MARGGKKLDLTQGGIGRTIVLFCLPIYASQLLQTLYNSVDSIVVGQFVGTNELAAISTCANVSNLIVGFFLGLGTGATVVVGRHFGAREYDRLRVAMQTTVLFSVALGLVVTVLCIVFSPQILGLLACPDEVYDAALLYLRFYLAGILFISLYNVLSSIMRAVGDSDGPFWFLAVSSFTNVGLDFLFVAGLGFGIAGAGLATVLSQALSVALCFHRLMRMDERWRLTLKGARIEGGVLKEIVGLGVPAGVQSAVISFSNIFVQRYVNGFSAAAISGIGAGQRIDQLVTAAPNAIGLGITSFIAQNTGAGEYGRARSGAQLAMVFGLFIAAVFSVPIYLFAPQFMAIFSSDSAVIEVGVEFIRFIMPFWEILGGYNMVVSGVLRGYGYSTSVMVFNLLGIVAVRQVFLAIGLSLSHTLTIIYACYPLGWLVGTIPMAVLYFTRVRKRDGVDAPFMEG